MPSLAAYAITTVGVIVLLTGLGLAGVVSVPRLDARRPANEGERRKTPARTRAGGVLVAIVGLWMVLLPAQVSQMSQSPGLSGIAPGSDLPQSAAERESGDSSAEESGASDSQTEPQVAGSDAPAEESGSGPSHAATNGETGESAPVGSAGESTGSESSGVGAAGDGPALSTALPEDGSDQITNTNKWRYLQMRGIDGQTHKLQDYVGKPLYVKFWGTWCPICMRELDTFSEVAATHNARGDVQVVSVVAPGHAGEMSEDEFVEWARDQGLDFPVFMDSTDELNQFFALAAYPTSLFVDSTGSVQLVRTGGIDSSELEDILAGLT